MKKSILGLTVSALFMVGAAQAATNPNDISADLQITGSVVSDITSACTVSPSQDSITLPSQEVNALIEQGANAESVVPVTLRIVGGTDCSNLVTGGKMAYKFTGVSDNAEGTALANQDTTAQGATGVGVGVFRGDNTPVRVNSTDSLPAYQEGTTIGLSMVKLAGQTPQAGRVSAALTIEIERL
ncbi:fimbrial protein [Cronobacter universalis]|uniref:fimbrial protein n=1 Tax=Cronobacter universalis TaxID=535744 RepID=UPI0024AE95FF|nr:fimbrial protein [Cronobacter universalis]ELY7392776.1 type 1 fimbrial protein [Cronobacter universalis]MDI7660998.1 fimbrial protein [Cronobacter universalis]